MCQGFFKCLHLLMMILVRLEMVTVTLQTCAVDRVGASTGCIESPSEHVKQCGKIRKEG
jgi:hypothetical protein